jgi:hypothetical protein
LVAKDLVILANSDKMKGHCIAGKDIGTGEWVRIINNFKFSGGEAAPFYFQGLEKLYGNGYGPYLGAHVRINFSGQCPIYCQPENWEIDGTKWDHLGKYPDEKLRNLIDKKYPVWLGNPAYGEHNDIPVNACNPKKPLKSSLVFLELTASQHLPRIYLKANWRGKISPSLEFRLNGIEYDFPVKDHDFNKKITSEEIEPGSYDSLLVTLGVGQLYEKMQSHYKLAVGIVQST